MNKCKIRIFHDVRYISKKKPKSFSGYSIEQIVFFIRKHSKYHKILIQ